jgi:hypothetical protein
MAIPSRSKKQRNKCHTTLLDGKRMTCEVLRADVSAQKMMLGDVSMLPPGLMDHSRGILPSPPGLFMSGTLSKSKRQGAYVKLNNSICSAADASPEALLQLVEKRHHEMNLVNLSTALHRLARIAEEGHVSRTVMLDDSRLVVLLAVTRTALNDGDVSGKARCLSTIAWAIARLGLVQADTMQHIAVMASSCVEDFKPYELGILLWSFAKLQMSQTELFSAACKHILLHLDEYGAACLATLVWSLTTAQTPSCGSLIRKAAEKFADCLKGNNEGKESIKPVALENMMWGLATLQVYPSRESLWCIAEATLYALPDFKVHEFTIILWAFARLGVYHDGLFTKASYLAQRSAMIRSSMHPQGIANLLWAFARYSERHRSGQFASTVAALLPTCMHLLPQLKPQELGCMLSSLSKLGKPWGEDASMDEIFMSAARRGVDLEPLHGPSLPTVVSILAAYSRFMGVHREVVEPCRKFMIQLVTCCPQFESSFTPQSLLSLLQVMPAVVSPSQDFHQALATIGSAVARSIHKFPLPRLALAINRLAADFRSQLLEHAKVAELMQLATEDAAQESNPDVLPMACSIAPEYAFFTSDSWLRLPNLRPELWDLAAGSAACAIDDEPVYVTIPDDVKTISAQPGLSFLEDQSLIGETPGDASSIVFEVNSDAIFEICSVSVRCYCNGNLYAEEEFSMEAGWDIANTQILNLASLPEGEHKLCFNLNRNGYDVQYETLTFRICHPHATSPLPQIQKPTTAEPPPSIVGDGSASLGTWRQAMDPLEMERQVKTSKFGSDVSCKSTNASACDEVLFVEMESGEE